jgi:uncharacterized damage-inducible protein DinB
MTRDEILKNIQKEHAKLIAAMHGLSDEVITSKPVMNDWTIKDMLGHISMWYRFAITFLDEYVQRGAPRPSGLSGLGVDEYNERELKLRRDWSLARVRDEFDAAYQAMLSSVEKLDDEQLNAPLAAPWEPGTTLERLVAWNAYEHEPEHTAQIQAWLKKSATPKRPTKRTVKTQAHKPVKKTVRQNGKTGVRRTNRKTS